MRNRDNFTEEIQWFKNSYKTSTTIAKSCWMHLIHAYLEAVDTIIWLPRAALSSEIIKLGLRVGSCGITIPEDSPCTELGHCRGVVINLQS
jgi:hypothetical protein